MPTPTFLDLQASQPEPTPADALSALRRGDFSPAALLPLSDLSRADARAVAIEWPGFPEPTRLRALRMIGELVETNVRVAFGRMLRIALDDPSAPVRQLAVAALWEDEGSDLCERLSTLAAEDPSVDVRAEAIQGLGRIAELAALGELEPDASTALMEQLRGWAADAREPPIVRRRALESVAVFGRACGAELLIRDAFEHDDPAMQAAALYAMGRSLDRRWLTTVLGEFDSPDAEMRYEAARASGQFGDPVAIAGLTGLARDHDSEVRLAAIDALGKIGTPAAVKVLHALKQEPEEDEDSIAEALNEALLTIDALRAGE